MRITIELMLEESFVLLWLAAGGTQGSQPHRCAAEGAEKC